MIRSRSLVMLLIALVIDQSRRNCLSTSSYPGGRASMDGAGGGDQAD
ncbi:hypothetical protein [Terriglobus albidus]|nr:hypothetical protein [Terriglobus albidus]